MHELQQRTVEHVDDNIDESTHVAVCPICGWWKILRIEEEINGTGYFEPDPEEFWIDGSYRKNRLWGAYGSLKELDLVDIDLPIEDVRAYLVGRYEKRFELHPRLFEQTVASVFEDLGYISRVTAYTNDGGIDVILEGINNQTIGVQVKRYKNSIQVEQIRSLAGALLIGGYTKGMFVTTSKYQSGAGRVSAAAESRGIAIELIDSDGLYSALEIAQRNRYEYKNDPDAPFYDLDNIPMRLFN
ncbi:restriction endonuclease [Sulfuriferula nivalis]|uniref:Restriction endonuclease type IV Mrr domain-containing protein n=1 Tax=Sulfuriferula nivalis TaxID=2675298 RepID=A0A809RI86_9PROT|nr:restriction endonuclease [Sulfuriferula nivalis]BBP01619.1 hypothetical protein SFSGTM_23270 [Sulfuriferula nivalis]